MYSFIILFNEINNLILHIVLLNIITENYDIHYFCKTIKFEYKKDFLLEKHYFVKISN